MKLLLIVFLFASPLSFGANQCRQPLEKLLKSAEDIAAKYGPDCLTAVRNGSTLTGERAKRKCKEQLGKENFNKQAALLRRYYDDAVHICNNECENKNYDSCKKGLSDLPVYGTKGARVYLRKIKD